MSKKFVNIQSLTNKGMLPLFELNSNNYMLALVDSTSVISKVFIINTGSRFTYNAYVDVSSEDLEDSLKDLLENQFASFYPSMTKKISVKTKPYTPTPDDLKIKSLVKVNGGYQDVKFYDRLLSTDGFDFSACYSSLVAATELDYTFCNDDEEAQALIKANESIFSYFKPNIATWRNNVRLAYEGVKQGKYSVVIFKGPAGTGKSILARQFAYLMKAPLVTYQVTDSTTKDDLFGTAIVNTDPKIEGQFVFAIGPVLKASTRSWQCLLDEINMGQASGINGLNQVFDDTNIIEHDGKQFPKGKSPVFYLTMNEGYEGTNGLNPALKSRTIVVDVPRLSRDEFADRLSLYVTNKLHASLKTGFYKQLFSFTEYMQDTSKKFAENVEFCIRNAQKLCATVLTKSCNLSEFTDAVYMAYVDFLSMDNDNTESLDTLKKSPQMVDHINKLYDLYDYKVTKSVEESELIAFEDIMFADEETASPSSSATTSPSGSANLDIDSDLDDLDAFLNKDAKEESTTEEEE